MGAAARIERADLEVALKLLTPENRLVLRVCAETGARVSEALALTKRDLDSADKNGGQLYLFESKAHKTRRVYLSKPLRRALYEQYSSRSVYIFPNRLHTEKHRTRQAVWADLKRARKALRIKEQLSPHSVRKMVLREKFDATGELAAVQKWARHRDMAVTAVYVLAKQCKLR